MNTSVKNPASASMSQDLLSCLPKLTINAKSTQGLDDGHRRDRLLYLTGVIEGIAMETVYYIEEIIDHGTHLEVVWETMPTQQHMACVLDAWRQHSVKGVGVVQHTFKTPSSCFTGVYARSASDLQNHREAVAHRTSVQYLKVDLGLQPLPNDDDAGANQENHTDDDFPF